MKKTLAFLLGICLLCVFAGCGSNSDTAATTTAATTETTEATQPAEAVGTVIASMGAVFEISYDEKGMIVELKGANEAGELIAKNCQQYLGRECVHGVRGLLRYAATNSLIGSARTFSIRVKHGDPLPSDSFIDTIVTDTQYLADEECTGIRMVRLEGDALTEDGLISEATAKYMAALHMEIEVDQLSGGSLSGENVYFFSDDDASCTVDAVTGEVSE